jgi:multiple sugar transport system permease protein
MNRRSILKNSIPILLTLLFLAVVLYPFYWTLFSSFKDRFEIVSAIPRLLPTRFILDNYKAVLGGPFYTVTMNSLMVATVTVLIGLALAIPAAFAIARLKFPGATLISRSTLLLYLFPTIVLIVPIFNLANKLGLINNPVALVIIYVGLTTPFAMWLLSSFLQGVPHELEEQGMVDGLSKIGSLIRITLPLSTPGIAAAGFFIFITAWGEYIFSFLLMSSEARKTLPVGLNYWISVYSISWGPLTAAAILATLPVLIIFLFLGRYFVESLTAGGLKG